MIDAETQKFIQGLVEREIGKFFDRNLAFRARKVGDTPTDARQLSTQGNVTVVVQNALANYLSLAGGNMNDGANIGTGSTNGTIIASATSQKLGFHGKTATVQQANTAGNVSAGGTYTSTEQAMLNDAYSALRNKGLLS